MAGTVPRVRTALLVGVLVLSWHALVSADFTQQDSPLRGQGCAPTQRTCGAVHLPRNTCSFTSKKSAGVSASALRFIEREKCGAVVFASQGARANGITR